MAGASLFALLDDIATLLDDVSVLTKVAAKKTAGVLGDDLALNAEQVTGVRAQRELPVVWAVFKGSALNKLIMVPIALLLSVLAPWTITVANKQVDMVAFEKKRIRGAIRTDAILSAEIIVIVLGTVQDADLITQISVLSFLAAAITVGVYGLVAGIVKMDDVGLHLVEKPDDARFAALQHKLGAGILLAAPKLMRTLSIVGTAAMFLVGGGILVHGLPPVADLLHLVEAWAQGLPSFSGLAGVISTTLYNGLFGFLAGGVLVVLSMGIRRLLPGKTADN